MVPVNGLSFDDIHADSMFLGIKAAATEFSAVLIDAKCSCSAEGSVFLSYFFFLVQDLYVQSIHQNFSYALSFV